MSIRSAHFLPGTQKRLGNKYLLLECLGDGSHGWVWRAERLLDGQVVAVKIPKQLTKEDRALSEGKELIGIEQHPNVIQIFDMGRVPPEREWFAIEMEYFPSESLAQKLERRAQNFGTTYERLFRIFTQVLEAVGFLSNLPNPISHGDIKPHNILVGAADLVKLTDFGSSALPEEIYVRTRENGGTVLYSAPEFSDCISRHGSFDELLRGDIYSLGVLLYQLTTGKLPHDTPAQIRSHIPFPKPSEINSGICGSLEAVILKCLEKHPQDRFATIMELQQAFRGASQDQLRFDSVIAVSTSDSKVQDWSTTVVAALESGNYLQAAKLAATEFDKTGDARALLQQLNALYRAKRWFDFEEVFLTSKHLLSPDTAQAILILAIKVFLLTRKLDIARQLSREAKIHAEESIDFWLLEASILGMEANYGEARKILEFLNQKAPGNLNILKRLIQVCEQGRDYHAASSYLRASLRIGRHDPLLASKRDLYERMGIW